MRTLCVIALILPAIHAQVCVSPARLAPGGTAAGVIDASACRTTDGTPHLEYSLLLPVRGQFRLSQEPDGLPVTLVLRSQAGREIASGESIATAAEAGQYTVAIFPQEKDATGAFHLRSEFVPEPDAFCAFSAPAGLNETISGRLGSASCRMPDGSRFDQYAISALGAGTLDIAITAADFAPSVILRDEDNRQLAVSNDGRLQYPFIGNGRYTVVAFGEGAAEGDYEVALSFEPAADDPCRPVATLRESGEHSGTMKPEGCGFTDDYYGQRILLHHYTLAVAEAGFAEIGVSSDAFDPVIYLLDGAGNETAWDGMSVRGQAALRMDLRPGNYTLVVFSFESADAGYTLRYTFTPGAPAAPRVTALESGVTLRGDLAAVSATRTRSGIADLYRVTTSAAGLLEVAIYSPEFSPGLELRDSRDNLVAEGDPYSGTLALDLPAGTYTIAASSYDYAGAYLMAYRFTERDLPVCDAPLPLETETVGVLYGGSCRDRGGRPVDRYEFTTPEDGITAVAMSSYDLSGLISVEDADGNVLRRTGQDGTPLVVQYLPAGTYRLNAAAADSASAGYYELRRYFQAGERPAGCAPRRTLSPGETVDADLDLAACQFPGDTFAHVYRLDVTETADLQIAMTSGEVDSYVMVLDAKGNTLADDDDGGGDYNAKTSVKLDPGSYHVVATTAGSYEAGAYRLSVAPVAPAAQ